MKPDDTHGGMAIDARLFFDRLLAAHKRLCAHDDHEWQKVWKGSDPMTKPSIERCLYCNKEREPQ